MEAEVSWADRVAQLVERRFEPRQEHNNLLLFPSQKRADSLSVCPTSICMHKNIKRMIMYACYTFIVKLKDPVVHVSVWWITETRKHPACT